MELGLVDADAAVAVAEEEHADWNWPDLTLKRISIENH